MARVAPFPLAAGQRTDLKLAAYVAAACDKDLSPAALRWFGLFLWLYRPGRIYRGYATSVGDGVGLPLRTTRRCTAALRAQGHLVAIDGGLVSRIVEDHLPADLRVQTLPPPTQADLRFLGDLPKPVSTYLRRQRAS